VSPDVATTLETDETLTVGVRRFAVVAEGDHAGWALEESDRLRLLFGVGAGSVVD
jgi:hypothetical protein